MPKQAKSYRDFSGGLQTIRDIRDLTDNEVPKAVNVMFDKRGAIRTMGGASEINTPTDLSPATATQVGGYGLAILESDYETEVVTITGNSNVSFSVNSISCSVSISSIQIHVPTSAQMYVTLSSALPGYAVGNKVIISGTAGGYYDGLYEIKSGGDSTHLVLLWTVDYGNAGAAGSAFVYWLNHFNTGDQISISNTTNDNGLYTIRYIASSVYMYLDVETLSTDANTSAIIKSIPSNEILILLSDAEHGQLDTYSKNNDVWTTNQASVDTTSGNLAYPVKLQSYSIDGVIRICDAEFRNSNKIQWFGFINNTHFPDCTAEDIYYGWYAKDNTLAPPTAGGSAINEGGTGYPTVNVGFDFDVTTPANSNSTWDAATYECALSFIYDGNQESLLQTVTGTITVGAGGAIAIVVKAKTDSTGYDPRITGGRLYCRISGSGDAWALLCDIDMRLGGRATLDGTYSAWVNGTTPATDIKTGTITSLGMNVDTYESLNGYSHEVESNSIGRNGEGWKTGIVAGRRAFVANVRRYDQLTAANKTYADRIYYSCVNKFDTFPTNQYLDVVRGDSESYVCLKSYADRLLAFKNNSVQIINIASGSDADWYLEENKKYHGICHPAAVCDTDFGVAWINKSGCFVYNGSEVVNLIWDKISASDWSSFIGVTQDAYVSIIGFERNKKQLIIMRDCTGTQSNGGDVYIYDFYTKSWTTGTDIFTDSSVYTNFVHDWNGDLMIGKFSGTTTTFYKWSDTSTSQSVTVETKDDDLGNLIHIKKIYRVYISAKELGGSDEVITVKYSVDGSNTFKTDNFDYEEPLEANEEGVLVFVFSSPIPVQSLQLQITYSGNVLINDISVEFRTISKRVS